MIFGTSFVPNQLRKYFVRLNSVRSAKQLATYVGIPTHPSELYGSHLTLVRWRNLQPALLLTNPISLSF